MTEHTVEWETLKGRAENIRRLVRDFQEDLESALNANRFYANEFEGIETSDESARFARDNMEDVMWGFEEGEK